PSLAVQSWRRIACQQISRLMWRWWLPDDPTPTRDHALSAKLRELPSWWLRKEFEKCGNERWLALAHLPAWQDRARFCSWPYSILLAAYRHFSCHSYRDNAV